MFIGQPKNDKKLRSRILLNLYGYYKDGEGVLDNLNKL